MISSKSLIPVTVLMLAQLLLPACSGGNRPGVPSGQSSRDRNLLADELEKSLFGDLIQYWYPGNIDSVFGGYTSDYEYDWTRSDGPQVKALVQQARHVWSASFLYESYPGRREFLDHAAHGFRFLRDRMWDTAYGGFFAYCMPDGTPQAASIDDKRIYGQAFAVYGLSQYYRVSRDPEALELAGKAFLWMEEHAHDPQYGGYFEFLKRDGTPLHAGDPGRTEQSDDPAAGLKDYNSSIHLMEALTALYGIRPDSLVRARLEEMFYLIRDTFVHPDGYLQLYFYPDWRLVPAENMADTSRQNYWFTRHYTYGHDVETAFLLLETAHVLGWEGDEKTLRIAKRLVDHSLESGWDKEAGGFFDAGRDGGNGIRIISRHKSWWGQAEGMNALLMMDILYPGDPNDYYGKFLKAWHYIDACLIDKENGGWYNFGLDTFPENAKQKKSHIWKTTYHNTRAMVHCIGMLRSGTPMFSAGEG